MSGGSFDFEWIGMFSGSLAVGMGGLGGEEMCNGSSARQTAFPEKAVKHINISSFFPFTRHMFRYFFFLLGCPVLGNVRQLQLELKLCKNLLP